MAKYSLRFVKDKSMVDADIKPLELKLLDEITRKYYGRKGLIEGLTINNMLPLGLDGSWSVKIMQGVRNKKNCRLVPIYKEQYISKKGDPIYDQILDFATMIGEIYEKYAKKIDGHYIIPNENREYAANDMRKINNLRYPEFYNFSKDYFIENIYVSENVYNENNDGVYNRRKKIDFSGITVYDNFYNKEDKTKVEQVNKEIAIDFYNDLLYGFHKIFYKKDKPFEQDYNGIRKYYKAYYNKFIKDLIKDQKDVAFVDAEQLSFIDENNMLKEFPSTNIEELEETNYSKSIDKVEVDKLDNSYSIEEDGEIHHSI